MNLTKKLLRASFPISAIGIAMFALPAVAAPINVLDVLQNAPQVGDVQTVQWVGWNSGAQYGSDYEYYGPQYGSRSSRSFNPGERSNTGTQYGPDYGYYGPRSGSRSSRSGNPGERSNTGTQYGPDYGYYGPR
jgi:hypothetical protein